MESLDIESRGENKSEELVLVDNTLSGSQFHLLPDEIILIILKYLDFSDLISLSRTNKAFYNLSIRDSLWKRLYSHYFVPLSAYSFNILLGRDVTEFSPQKDCKLAFSEALMAHKRRVESDKEAVVQAQRLSNRETRRYYWQILIYILQSPIMTLVLGGLPFIFLLMVGYHLDYKFHSENFDEIFYMFWFITPLTILSSILAADRLAWGDSALGVNDIGYYNRDELWYRFPMETGPMCLLFSISRINSSYQALPPLACNNRPLGETFHMLHCLGCVISLFFTPLFIWFMLDEDQFGFVDSWHVAFLPYWIFCFLFSTTPLFNSNITLYYDEEMFGIWLSLLLVIILPSFIVTLLLALHLEDPTLNIPIFSYFIPLLLPEALGLIGLIILAVVTILDRMDGLGGSLDELCIGFFAYIFILGPWMATKFMLLFHLSGWSEAAQSFTYLGYLSPLVFFLSYFHSFYLISIHFINIYSCI